MILRKKKNVCQKKIRRKKMKPFFYCVSCFLVLIYIGLMKDIENITKIQVEK